MRAPHRKRVGHVDERRPVRCVEALGEPVQRSRERRAGVRGNRYQQGCGRARPGTDRRRLGDDHVRVGTAEAEAADRADQPAARTGAPRFQRGYRPQPAATEVDFRVRRGEVDARRQHPVPHRQQHLEQTRDTGRHGGVSDVAFHRADCARPDRVTVPAEHLVERLHLDRIAQRGTGSVCLDVGHVLGYDAGPAVDPRDQAGLAGRAGRGDSVGTPVTVDAAAEDDAVDLVAVGQRTVQALEEHGPRPLAEHDAVG